MSRFGAISAIGLVVRSSFGNLGAALRMSWPWMVLLMLMQGGLMVMFPALPTGVITGMEPWAGQSPDVMAVLFFTIPANMIAYASIAVNWHRYLALAVEAEGREKLRLDWPVWSYLGNAFLAQAICVVILAALLIAGMLGVALLAVFRPDEQVETAAILAAMAASVWALPAMLRVFVKLPAVAIERDDYSFVHAWRDSRGRSLRLFGFLVMLFSFMLFLALASVAPMIALSEALGSESLSGRLAAAFGQFAINWWLLLVAVTALTTLYAVFAEGRKL